jgi:Ankyrin repeat
MRHTGRPHWIKTVDDQHAPALNTSPNGTSGWGILALDDSGLTPLQWIALTGRYREVCQYLITQGAKADSSDIFSACSLGDLAAVKRLLDADARRC